MMHEADLERLRVQFGLGNSSIEYIRQQAAKPVKVKGGKVAATPKEKNIKPERQR